jgi:hypothetical protein
VVVPPCARGHRTARAACVCLITCGAGRTCGVSVRVHLVHLVLRCHHRRQCVGVVPLLGVALATAAASASLPSTPNNGAPGPLMGRACDQPCAPRGTLGGCALQGFSVRGWRVEVRLLRLLLAAPRMLAWPVHVHQLCAWPVRINAGALHHTTALQRRSASVCVCGAGEERGLAAEWRALSLPCVVVACCARGCVRDRCCEAQTHAQAMHARRPVANNLFTGRTSSLQTAALFVSMPPSCADSTIACT